jgi:succinate-acetate transporter protein
MARDALIGTGLAIFSTMWLVAGISLLTGEPGTTNDALGTFLILGAISLLLLLLSAGRGRLIFGVIIAIGCARLAVTGLYEIEAGTGLQHASGILGLVLAGAAAYGICALLMEDLPRSSLLPVGRSGRAASSVEGTFAEQVEEIENEAGVRRQL